MHRAGKFRRQCGIDQAMAIDAALARKGLRHNIHSEMGLAAGPVTHVAFMQM